MNCCVGLSGPTFGLLIGLSASIGCEREKPAVELPTAPIPVAQVAEELEVDASIFPPPPDPPAPSGDLRAELDNFKNLDLCVSEHAALDPLVGDALHAVGYDTFLRDACRLLDALKVKDAKRCQPIAASALRARCQAFVAMAEGEADACPFDNPTKVQVGREPVCIAVASRDPRLCAAAGRLGKAACGALVTRSEAPCVTLVEERERQLCRREVVRWRRILEPPMSDLAVLSPAQGHVEIHAEPGSIEPAVSQIEIDVSRGVVIELNYDGTHLRFGANDDSYVPVVAPTPSSVTRFGASVRIAALAPNAASVEHIELHVPGLTSLVYPGVLSHSRARIERLEKTRGGEVKVVVEGTIGVSPHAFNFRADIVTFVRDIVKVRE